MKAARAGPQASTSLMNLVQDGVFAVVVGAQRRRELLQTHAQGVGCLLVRPGTGNRSRTRSTRPRSPACSPRNVARISLGVIR